MRSTILIAVAVLLVAAFAHAGLQEVPAAGPVLDPADAAGALLVVKGADAHKVVQIADAEWQRTPDGNYTYLWIDGQDLQGQPVFLTLEIAGGVPVSVTEAGLQIDDNGFLKSSSDEQELFDDYGGECGVHRDRWCENNLCGTACGTSCQCSGTLGECISKEVTWCGGDCPSNYICMGTTVTCGCQPLIPDPPDPSTNDDDLNKKKEIVDLEKKDKRDE